jgi:A/G-specific adenine glycosylase
LYNTNISKEILCWYDNNKRDLPWRKTNDPYKIWLSEVMLQQTRVETVIPYYNIWLENYKTIQSVAQTNLDKLLKIWEGMGYYSRCKNFYYASKEIIYKYNGIIPNQFDVFRSLPGVGDYIAGAVMSIAFNQPHTSIDGNHRRVISRILGIKNLSRHNKNRINNYLKKLVAIDRPGDINQAIMDIGSTICKPKEVFCDFCPVQFSCKACVSSKPLEYPKKIYKKKIPTRNLAAALIEYGDYIFISKRPVDGQLAGLWELPNIELKNGESPEKLLTKSINTHYACTIEVKKNLGLIHHAFTHFKMNITLFRCILKHNQKVDPSAKWIRWSELDQYAFSKGNHKLFQLYQKENV